MNLNAWLQSLDSAALEKLSAALVQEEKRRARPVGLDPITEAEVERLQGVKAARQTEASRQWQQHISRTLRSRIERFEAGRLGLCDCAECLAGYVLRDPERMCDEGKRQFFLEAGKWQQYTA